MTPKDQSKFPYDISEDGTLTTDPTEGSHDMRNNILNFPDRNSPDNDCQYKDDGGSWDVFFNSDKPAPYNQMKDVILYLAAIGRLKV